MFLFLHDLLDSVAEVVRIVDDNQPLVISFEHAPRVRAGGKAGKAGFPDPGGRDGDIQDCSLKEPDQFPNAATAYAQLWIHETQWIYIAPYRLYSLPLKSPWHRQSAK